MKRIDRLKKGVLLCFGATEITAGFLSFKGMSAPEIEEL
jgi:hypothetical protein